MLIKEGMWESRNVYSSSLIWLRTSLLGDGQIPTWSIVVIGKERNGMRGCWLKHDWLIKDFWIGMIRSQKREAISKMLRHRPDKTKWRQWKQTSLPHQLVFSPHFVAEVTVNRGGAWTGRVQELPSSTNPLGCAGGKWSRRSRGRIAQKG